MNQISVTRIEEAALLRAAGFRLAEATAVSGGIVLAFEDSAGRAAALLARHRGGGVPVNSQGFSDALRWSKDAIFQARRDLGLENGRWN